MSSIMFCQVCGCSLHITSYSLHTAICSGCGRRYIYQETVQPKKVISYKGFKIEAENGVLKEYNGFDVDVVIPEGVKSIDSAAFLKYNKTLKSVKFPTSLNSLGFATFFSFSALQSISIPGSVKSIGAQCFSHCTALAEVELQEGIERIGERAFGNCTSLENIVIPESVTAIFEHGTRNNDICQPAFWGCNSLKNIIAPSRFNYKSFPGTLYYKEQVRKDNPNWSFTTHCPYCGEKRPLLGGICRKCGCKLPKSES